MTFQTLDDLDDGQRVLVRFDLNSPVDDGEVQDNRRFGRHAATLSELRERDFAVAVMAHQGRPGDDDFVSLSQHAEILSDHIDADVDHVTDTYGDEALAAIDALEGGDVVVLENTRMADGELPEEEPEVKERRSSSGHWRPSSTPTSTTPTRRPTGHMPPWWASRS